MRSAASPSPEDIGEVVVTCSLLIRLSCVSTFAAHQGSADALKNQIFFAMTNQAWERGLNENTNTLSSAEVPRSNVCSTRDLENPSACNNRK
jgi:hypothetical protein